MATISLPDWARPLLDERRRFKVLYGGRGSGKTWAVAAALVIDSLRRPLRIACVREHQKSIHESAKLVIENWIKRMGVADRFNIRAHTIDGVNGSHFFFHGLAKASEEDIKGWEAVNRVWVEEAHRMSERSRELLYPTIFRTDDSEMWFTFNPLNRSDPVYRDFVLGRRSDTYVRLVNYMDNPWFPEGLEHERLETLKNEPERYAHIWLGEPDDEGAAPKVLPYALLQMAVDAWPQREEAGGLHAGLDVADSGADRNSLAFRRGPCLLHVESWHGASLGMTTRRADSRVIEEGTLRMFYDVGGIGAGVRSHLLDMGPRPYKAVPVNFGGEVRGPDRRFTIRHTNFDFFGRRNSQLGWALRMRAQMTRRLMEGEQGILPDKCLFISPRMPRLEHSLAQMAQPEWEVDKMGRLRIEKQPEDAPSPDDYDAVALAFAQDSARGLSMRGGMGVRGRQRMDPYSLEKLIEAA